MTIVKQRKIISDEHVYESPRSFKKFLKGKKPKTQKRYSAYRRKRRDLLERGYNEKYDKKTRTFIYSKKGIDNSELKKKPKNRRKDEHYVHGIWFNCKVSAVEFQHVYHYESYEEFRSKTGLAKHSRVFPTHEVISYEFLGSKVVSN